MKRLLALLGLAAAVGIAAVIALATSGRSSSIVISPTNLPTAAPTGQMALYGHIVTLQRDRGRFEMRLDPACYTEGLTARVAYHGTVPNDRYVIEEGHRLLSYIVSSNAKIRVLTNHGTGPVLVPIKLGELMRIVNGGSHRKLFEPLSTGVWIRVHTDTIQEINQQYQP
jgi:hypothetical protein